MSTALPESEPKPHLTLRPPRGWTPLNLAELWEFRDLLRSLAGRDLRVRYKQTILGAAWVVFQPLMGAGIFTFVFGFLGQMEGSSFEFTLASTLAWSYLFANTVNKAASSMVGNSGMVSKVYFPRMVLPLSVVGSNLMDFAVGMGLLVVVLAVYQVVPGWEVLMLPVWIGLMLMLALGIGLLSASLMVNYRDVGYVLPVMIQFLMFGSPVGYSLANLQGRLPDTAWASSELLRSIYMLNPMASLLEGFRWSLLGADHPQVMLSASWAGYSAAVAVVTFLIGAYAFKRLERTFADVI